MKAFRKFVQTTIAGGILFLIPLVIIMTVAKKALELLHTFTEPWDEKLKRNIILGFDGHNILGIFLLLIICFIAGLLFRLAPVKRYVTKVEVKVLSYFPGYLLIKSIALEIVRDSNEQLIAPVLVKESDGYRPGFLTEQRGENCAVFFPEAPQVNSGELQIVPTRCVIRLSITNLAMRHIIRNLGKGMAELIAEYENNNVIPKTEF